MKRSIIALLLLALSHTAHADRIYNPKDQPQAEVLAVTLLLEAQIDGQNGMIAVGNVIDERHKITSQSLKEVCLWKKKGSRFHQFSCWNGKIKFSQVVSMLYTAQGRWVLGFAKMIIAGENVLNLVPTATHYFATYIPTPGWALKMVFIGQIGRHRFYREDRYSA